MLNVSLTDGSIYNIYKIHSVKVHQPSRETFKVTINNYKWTDEHWHQDLPIQPKDRPKDFRYILNIRETTETEKMEQTELNWEENESELKSVAQKLQQISKHKWELTKIHNLSQTLGRGTNTHTSIKRQKKTRPKIKLIPCMHP